MQEKINALLADAEGHARLGHFQEAIGLCEQVLSTDRRQLAALQLLARLHYVSGARDRAQHVMEETVSAWPDDHDARYRLACLYLENGNLLQAEQTLVELLGPDGAQFPAACTNMGVLRQKQGRLDDALDWYAKALQYQPQDLDARYNMGTVYRELGRGAQAADIFRQVLDKNPQHAAACNMLGVTEQDAGRFDEALSCFRRALAISPAFAEAHRNLAEVLLQKGEFETGWQEYEWRLRKPDHVVATTLGRPLWQAESLRDKNVFVAREQGIGDEIMFVRCIEVLQTIAGSCCFSCDRRLIPLLRRSFPGLHVLDDSDIRGNTAGLAKEVDFEIPVGSLPRAIAHGKEAVVPADSYLQADAQQCAVWKAKIAALGSGMKVGISWRGGGSQLVRSRRSIPLQQWSSLFSRPRVHFIDLQYGEHSPEIDAFRRETGLELHQLPGLDAFADIDGLAACMSGLDLVISVDNATAHLAGALGVPTWVLLPHVADWRWQSAGTSSCWYASVHLLRQAASGDWQAVLEEACTLLDSRCAARGGST